MQKPPEAAGSKYPDILGPLAMHLKVDLGQGHYRVSFSR
jgi:hypothetical protein